MSVTNKCSGADNKIGMRGKKQCEGKGILLFLPIAREGLSDEV